MQSIVFSKTYIYEIIITFIYITNFLTALNLIFREKRNIESTVAWIVVLATMPALGFIIYLCIGRRIGKDNMFRVKEKEDKIIKSNILDTQVKLQDTSSLDPRVNEYKDMIYSLANSNNAHYSDNNEIDIYPDPKDFFESLINELKNAKEYINIQFYIFKDDDIGNKIIDILLEKVNEGVEVRLLYDAVGSRLLSDRSIYKMKKNGIKIGSFFPSFLNLVNFNLNYRNHRKIVVIDGKTGFIGGNNVGDEYLGKDPKFGYWRDTHIKIIGDAVLDLNIRFILDWRYSTHEDLDLSKYFKNLNENIDNSCSCEDNQSTKTNLITKNTGVQIVSSGPDIPELEEIKYGYIKMIQKSRDYLYIQSPYFILDKTFIDTLKIACLSGVDVKIMIPSKPDHPFVYWASYSYAGELLKYGAKVYTYGKDAFLHAKTIVMDDSICSIGTANMDIRSFELNFEVNAFIYSQDIAIEQRTIFENDLKKCTELTCEIYDSRPTLIRFKESVSRLLSPIL